MEILLATFAIPFALIVIVLAARDGAHADDSEYQAAIGYDSGRGWLVMIGMIVLLALLAGAAGCGPLAMLAGAQP